MVNFILNKPINKYEHKIFICIHDNIKIYIIPRFESHKW